MLSPADLSSLMAIVFWPEASASSVLPLRSFSRALRLAATTKKPFFKLAARQRAPIGGAAWRDAWRTGRRSRLLSGLPGQAHDIEVVASSLVARLPTRHRRCQANSPGSSLSLRARSFEHVCYANMSINAALNNFHRHLFKVEEQLFVENFFHKQL